MLFVGGSAQHLGGGSWSVGALANESFHQEFFEGVGVPTLHAAANKAGRNRSLEAGGGSAMRPAPPAPPRPLPRALSPLPVVKLPLWQGIRRSAHIFSNDALNIANGKDGGRVSTYLSSSTTAFVSSSR